MTSASLGASGNRLRGLSGAALQSAFAPLLAVAAIIAGAALSAQPWTELAGDVVWFTALVVLGAPIVWRTLRGVAAGHFATDIVATLSIVGAVVLDQPLAGLIIVLMQTGGEALERYAMGRASSAVRALEEAAPRTAHRVGEGGGVEDVPVEAVAIGETVLVRPGELVPCDGVVVEGTSHVDTSQLTGEPVPVRVGPGAALMSGSANGETPITVRVTALARESQYARIVELVRSAQGAKSPLQRLADRYAVWFTPLTLVVCAVAYFVSRDPVRVLAVLVVATPCPLILATPVAIIGGINRAARRQIIVRHGGALEQLASVTIAVFDKTGTLTVGLPSVRQVVSAPSYDGPDPLTYAAAVERGSGHLLARTVVDAAAERRMELPAATGIVESAGRGVTGIVDGTRVTVGARRYVEEQYPALHDDLLRFDAGGAGLRAYIAIGGRLAGRIDYADALRPGIDRIVRDLASVGVQRTVLLSGDRRENATETARSVGITEVHGDLLPADKVRLVREFVDSGADVLMVGDGTNDAPALSTATVGVALAGHGGGITAEAADVVILVDEPSRVVDAMWIARRTLRVAKESIWAGLGLSAVAMGFAAFGVIPPAAGALLQEAIDAAVILNALRTSRAGPHEGDVVPRPAGGRAAPVPRGVTT